MTDKAPAAPMPTKAKALRELDRHARRVVKAQETLDHAMHTRDDYLFQVRETYGATYPELAEATGLSVDRIKQLLTNARRAGRRSLED